MKATDATAKLKSWMIKYDVLMFTLPQLKTRQELDAKNVSSYFMYDNVKYNLKSIPRSINWLHRKIAETTNNDGIIFGQDKKVVNKEFKSIKDEFLYSSRVIAGIEFRKRENIFWNDDANDSVFDIMTTLTIMNISLNEISKKGASDSACRLISINIDKLNTKFERRKAELHRQFNCDYRVAAQEKREANRFIKEVENQIDDILLQFKNLFSDFKAKSNKSKETEMREAAFDTCFFFDDVLYEDLEKLTEKGVVILPESHKK